MPRQVIAPEGRGELAAYALSGTAGTPSLQPVRRAIRDVNPGILGFGSRLQAPAAVRSLALAEKLCTAECSKCLLLLR